MSTMATLATMLFPDTHYKPIPVHVFFGKHYDFNNISHLLNYNYLEANDDIFTRLIHHGLFYEGKIENLSLT